MARGKSVTVLNDYLNVYRNVAMPGIAALYVQLHTGDPGANGTANVSAMTTRNQVTWNAPSNGSMTLATLAAFVMTTTETITDISLWTAASGGTFKESIQLTTPVPVINGSTVAFASLTLAGAPAAA